jgi:hypothetical protein
MIIGASIIGLLLSFSACSEQSPLQPVLENSVSPMTLAKKNTNTEKAVVADNSLVYPLTETRRFKFLSDRDCYQKGSLFMADTENKLGVREGAITPPPEIAWGEPVYITMTVDYDKTNNQLLFEFGPAGIQFDPAAIIRLDYSTLGIDIPVLYYIDEYGNYIEQTPESINVTNKWLKIQVNHFSRYAVAWSR